MFGTSSNSNNNDLESGGSAFDIMASGYNDTASCSAVFFNNNRKPQNTTTTGEAKSHDDLKEVESFLAQTMQSLSLEERDRALEDLHAIGTVPEESPSALKESLEAMSHYIDKVENDKKAYLIAKSMSTNYVTNEKRRLQFLRAENYDPKKATKRLNGRFRTSTSSTMARPTGPLSSWPPGSQAFACTGSRTCAGTGRACRRGLRGPDPKLPARSAPAGRGPVARGRSCALPATSYWPKAHSRTG